jgi:hypothetical protein
MPRDSELNFLATGYRTCSISGAVEIHQNLNRKSHQRMSLFKRGKWYWMDDVVNGIRYRLPLKTTNWPEAKGLEKDRLAEIAAGKLGSQGAVARQSFKAAAEAYVEERKLHSSDHAALRHGHRHDGRSRRLFLEESERLVSGSISEESCV